jgi:hypothetical protein
MHADKLDHPVVLKINPEDGTETHESLPFSSLYIVTNAVWVAITEQGDSTFTVKSRG